MLAVTIGGQGGGEGGSGHDWQRGWQLDHVGSLMVAVYKVTIGDTSW